MFPLDFPYGILSTYAMAGEWVLDPFCGRGTTNYASRLLGLPSVGIDSNPVAVAIAQAKLANTSPQRIMGAARRILDEVQSPHEVPEGEFWDLAFDKTVLHILCRLREGLVRDCRSASRQALRAIIMGALHGPQPKSKASYFSNQCPRTYAPKPRYAIGYWKRKNLTPQPVDVLQIIKERAERYYACETTTADGIILVGDSRKRSMFSGIPSRLSFGWVITSPPYYGMNTYIPDQWLRLWFLGGGATVNYSTGGQVEHSSPDRFVAELKQVWQNAGTVCKSHARLVIRFGALNDRRRDPLGLAKQSLAQTGWRIMTVKQAGSASNGRRQATHFARSDTTPLEEYDIWAEWID